MVAMTMRKPIPGIMAAAALAGAAGCGTGAREVPAPIWGVTVDNVENLPEVIRSLQGFSRTLTARIVFDSGTSADYYLPALKEIRKYAFIMGELHDSWDIKNTSVADHKKRTREYWKVLKDYVDIWEIGNEVNGDWLGPIPDTVAKIKDAARYMKSRGAVTALTVHYTEGCGGDPEYDLFPWIKKNLDAKFRRDIDYVLVSYYEVNCDGLRPDWKPVFTRLSGEFPGAKLGFGEVGLDKPASGKPAYLRRYYATKVDVPNYVGGFFWWFFYQDCVPKEKPLWKVLQKAVH